MSVIPATAVGWTPTVEHPERDFYYMANIRYPVLADPLGMDRVAMLLWKAREALSRITFQWVQLKSPKRGECFLVVRPEDSSYRPPDGYKWQPKPELSTKAVGDKTVELSRFKMIESHEASLVRLEYRLVLPNNRLIYVHYLEDNTTTTLHNLTTIRQPPAVSIPDPRMLMTTVMRPPAMRQTSGQVASVPTRPGLVPRGVPPVRRIPAPVAQAQPTRQSIDDLPDLINDLNHDAIDVVEQSYLRMKARQAEVDMICMGSFQALPASNVTNGNLDSVQAELDSVKSELAHFQEVEGRQREKDLRIRKEYDSLDEILKMADLKDGFAEVAREYMNAVGIENIQMIPAIRKR